ncbi:MAG: hypothetical protein AAGF13_00935 [Pseudomonadota bacterium]
MAYLTNVDAPRSHSALARLTAWLHAAALKLEANASHNRIDGLSEHELRDIGLSGLDVQRAYDASARLQATELRHRQIL